MKEIRELIQSKLDEIDNLESGVPIPDDIVENGKTYFGYELQETFISSDDSKNRISQIDINGRIVKKNISTENTLEIVDGITYEVINHLKDLNFKCNSKDITLENNIRKILITGYVKYDEKNKKLIF